ncbi:hypothetical protein RCL1_004370 [Eukaryota sp. TZLM3-RCL]
MPRDYRDSYHSSSRGRDPYREPPRRDHPSYPPRDREPHRDSYSSSRDRDRGSHHSNSHRDSSRRDYPRDQRDSYRDSSRDRDSYREPPRRDFPRERDYSRDREYPRDRDFHRDRDFPPRDRDSHPPRQSHHGRDRDRGDDFSRNNRKRLSSDVSSPALEYRAPVQLIPCPPYILLEDGNIKRRVCRETMWDRPPEAYPELSVAEVAAVDPEFILDAINSNAPVSNRHSRRLYVGNVPLGMTDSELANFFNSALKTAGVCKFPDTDPVLSCQINQDKGFAFIEFHYIEDTTAALALDGVSLQGSALKVRRPKDYGADEDMNPETRLQIDQIPGIVRRRCLPSANRLVIGNLPAFITETQLKAILRPFGMLMSFELPMDTSTSTSRGYAYCQFCREQDTANVLRYLPMLDLFGSRLRVAFADRSPAPGPTFYDPASPIDLDTLTSRQDSTVIQMVDLLREGDLGNSFADVLNDIQCECELYGVVVSIAVPTPGTDGFGNAFVEFELDSDVTKALKELPKRTFNNRKFLVSPYPLDLYRKQVFY